MNDTALLKEIWPDQIYLPENIAEIINKDSALFDVTNQKISSSKKKKQNWSYVINRILLGYSLDYIKKYNALCAHTCEALSGSGLLMQTENIITLHKLVDDIWKGILYDDYTKDHKSPRIHISYNNEILDSTVFSQIMEHLHDLGKLDKNSELARIPSEFVSQILAEYSKKSLPEREKILFKETYEKLSGFLNDSPVPMISFKSVNSGDFIHNAYPYKIVASKEEMGLYLLYQENDSKRGATPGTIHLSRILPQTINVSLQNGTIYLDEESKKTAPFDPKVLEKLKYMEKNAPQYLIDELTTARVILTNHGVKAYRQIYFGRPAFTKENKIDSEHTEYTFENVSQNQLFRYFLRFERDDAVVMEPKELRERIISFHKSAVIGYKED